MVIEPEILRKLGIINGHMDDRMPVKEVQKRVLRKGGGSMEIEDRQEKDAGGPFKSKLQQRIDEYKSALPRPIPNRRNPAMPYKKGGRTCHDEGGQVDQSQAAQPPKPSTTGPTSTPAGTTPTKPMSMTEALSAQPRPSVTLPAQMQEGAQQGQNPGNKAGGQPKKQRSETLKGFGKH